MQDDILIDVIGNVYKETGELTEDGEPVCGKEDGYFVNVRIINDSQISSLFDEYVVAVEHQLRGWMWGRKMATSTVIPADIKTLKSDVSKLKNDQGSYATKLYVDSKDEIVGDWSASG